MTTPLDVNARLTRADRATVSRVIRRWSTSRREGNAGFAMVELMVSLVIIAIVMTAAIAFFVNGLRSDNGQRQRQEAVYLADQQMQTVQAIPANDLVQGRTSTAQAAALATSLAGSLNLPSQSDMSSTASYDGNTSDSTLIPMSISQTVNNIPYTIYTFIYACHLSAGSNNSCGSTNTAGSTQEIRVTVASTWTSNASCSSVCHYATSTLIDPNSDQTFNTNISTPTGAISSPLPASFYNDNTGVHGATPYETCTTGAAGNTVTVPGTEVIVTGTGFKSNIRVWISSGGGSIPTNTIYQPSATEVDLCLQTGDVPGSYTVSVINTDGGHFQTSLTEAPIVRWVALTGSGASQVLTLNGGGFVNGASYTGTGGVSGTFHWVSPQQATITSYVGPTAGATPSITVNDPSPGFQQTPAFSLPDMSATTSPTSVAVGTNVSVSVSGSGFETGLATTGVTNGSATASYISPTSAVIVLRGTAVGTMSFALLNPDGGVSNTLTLNVDPLPTISPVPGTRVVSLPFTVTGTNFMSGMTATLANGDPVALTYVSPTQVNLTVTGSTYGATTLTLHNPDGGIATAPITIDAPPVVTGVTVAVSGQVTETLTGTGFQSGTTITDPGGTIGTITHSGTTGMTFMITDTPGTQTLTLTNPDGGTTTVNVQLDAPLVITASTLTAFEGVPVTVAGSGFTAGVTTTTPGATVTYLSATSVRVTFGNAGSQTLVLTNPDGGSDSAIATVTGPTITGLTVAPTTPVHGGANIATVTVAGTGLTTTSTYTAFWTKGGVNTNETVTYVTPARSTTAAKFTIPTPATAGASGAYSLTVTVTNPDGSTDSFTKTGITVS